MNVKMVWGLTICLAAPLLTGCAANPGTIRGQSPSAMAPSAGGQIQLASTHGIGGHLLHRTTTTHGVEHMNTAASAKWEQGCGHECPVGGACAAGCNNGCGSEECCLNHLGGPCYGAGCYAGNCQNGCNNGDCYGGNCYGGACGPNGCYGCCTPGGDCAPAGWGNRPCCPCPDGDSCFGNGWKPTHYHFYSYEQPKNLVYPPSLGAGGPGGSITPSAVVQYPYYTCKGPDDYFYKH